MLANNDFLIWVLIGGWLRCELINIQVGNFLVILAPESHTPILSMCMI